MLSRKTLFICGGHFSPAIALTEELTGLKDLNIFYLGRKFALEGEKTLSFEYRQISKLQTPFLEITSGRLQRHLSFYTVFSLFKIPVGIIQSIKYFNKYKPDLIMSFGGYVAFPVSFTARLLGVDVITHEQTRVMGLANRIIARFAKLIKLTGLPVRKSIFKFKNTRITEFGNRKLQLIYITCGSLGSRSVNLIIQQIVPELLKKFRIFHICGESRNNSDYHRLSRLRSSLERKLKGNYFLVTSLDYQLAGEVLKNSFLVIARSGINTVAEIFIHRKKAILIPLPWAAYNEQLDNAEILKKTGLAKIINQEDLSGKNLLQSIDLLINEYQNNFRKSSLQDWQFQGSKKIADLILSEISYSGGRLN